MVPGALSAGHAAPDYGSFTWRIRSTCPGGATVCFFPHGQATWIENADVQSAQTGPSVTEIFSEIDLLRTEPPTEPELNSTKNYRNGIFVMSTTTRGGLIGQLAFMNLQGLSGDWLTTFADRLYAVTPAQITQAAKTHLDPARMSVVVVGDLKTVQPQIEAIAPLRDVIARP